MNIIKRSMLTIFVTAALMALLIPAAHAKGPADRVIITGPGLTEPLILTDREDVTQISMASLENFEAGSIDEPTGLGEGYALERQFEPSRGQYQTFDRAVYYADPAGDLGYVFYEGIENGSSDYDGLWFRARPVGDATMRMIIDNTLPRSFLLLMSASGDMRFLDAHTLDEIAAVHTGEKWLPLDRIRANAAGTMLYYHTNPAQHLFDLTARTNCPISDQPDFWIETLDGRRYTHTSGSDQIEVYDPHASIENTIIDLPYPIVQTFAPSTQEFIMGVGSYANGLTLTSVYIMGSSPYEESLQYDSDTFTSPPAELRTAWDTFGPVPILYLTDGLTALGMPFANRDQITETTLNYDSRAIVEAGRAWIDLLAAHNEQLYLYFPIGDNVLYDSAAVEAGDISLGILVIDAKKGNQLAHWLPDLSVTQGTYNRDYLYVIHTPKDDSAATLLQLDITTGDILQTVSLTPDIWTAALVRLNADAVQALGTGEAALNACP